MLDINDNTEKEQRLVQAIISDMKASLENRRDEISRRIRSLTDIQRALLDMIFIRQITVQDAGVLLGLTEEKALELYEKALSAVKSGKDGTV